MEQVLHAGLMATHMDGIWRGVLIAGPSGSGKSDLAIRLLGAGFSLVADDRTLIWVSGGILFGRAPDPLQGMIEVRGQGVFGNQATRRECRIVLMARQGTSERWPMPEYETFLGLQIPRLTLSLLEESAVARLNHALWHLGRGAEGAYLGGPASRTSHRSAGDSR